MLKNIYKNYIVLKRLCLKVCAQFSFVERICIKLHTLVCYMKFAENCGSFFGKIKPSYCFIQFYTASFENRWT